MRLIDRCGWNVQGAELSQVSLLTTWRDLSIEGIAHIVIFDQRQRAFRVPASPVDSFLRLDYPIARRFQLPHQMTQNC